MLLSTLLLLANATTKPAVKAELVESGMDYQSIWGHPESAFIVLGVGPYSSDGFRTYKAKDIRSDVLGQLDENFVGFNFFGDAMLERTYSTNRAGRIAERHSNWFNFGRYQVSVRQVVVRSGAPELNLEAVATFPVSIGGIGLTNIDYKQCLVGFGNPDEKPTAYFISRAGLVTSQSLTGVPETHDVTGSWTSKKSGLLYLIVRSRKDPPDLVLYSGKDFKSPFQEVYRQRLKPLVGTAVCPIYQPPVNFMAGTSDGAMFFIADGDLYRIIE